MGAHEGLLAQQLAADGHQVFATEITLGSFQALTMGVRGSTVCTLRGDGLEPLWDVPLDVVVIAGMGYDTILAILETRHRMRFRPQFILQPAQGGLFLHRAVVQAGWRIEHADIAAYRGRLYPTWRLNVYDENTTTDRSAEGQFLPREFRLSVRYPDWLRAELAYRRLRDAERRTDRVNQEIAWLDRELATVNRRDG